jgi:hypothetical protein
MGLSDAVNDWKDLISIIPTQYYAVFIKKVEFFCFCTRINRVQLHQIGHGYFCRELFIQCAFLPFTVRFYL